MLWWKKVLSCAAMSLLPDPQNALVEEGCAIPALRMQAAVMIHRMLVEERCYACAAMQAAVVIHRMPGARRVCYPALPCKLLL
jgi:hypothetical protein